MFVFLGVHFTAVGVLEHVMNAIRVCIAQTRSLSCVLFTFCIMSLNLYWSKKWHVLFTSCNVFCMQAWHFRNFQIRASLPSPCHYIFRAYTTKNLKLVTLARCRVLFIAVGMFTRHTLDVQLSVLDCECSSPRASTSDGFNPIIACPLHEWHNTENTLPISVCALSWWQADSRKRNNSTVAWFQASNVV